MHEGQNIPLDRESILARLAELDGVPGHEAEREILSEAWAELYGLPKTPPLLAGPTEFREDLAAHPLQDDSHKAVSDRCALPDLVTVFERGRQAGRAEGMQQLLRVLFAPGAETTSQIGERALVVCYSQAFPDAPAKSVRELAALAGWSRGTTENRIASFRESNHGLPKLDTLSLDSIG